MMKNVQDHSIVRKS